MWWIKSCLLQENASKFLPKLPPLSRSFGVNKINNEENLEDTKRIRDQNHLNILLVSQEGGKLSLSVFGLFPCGVIDLLPHMKEAGCDTCGAVVGAAVSDDLKVMCVFVEGENKVENVSAFILTYSKKKSYKFLTFFLCVWLF